MANFLKTQIVNQIETLVIGDNPQVLVGPSPEDPGILPMDSPVKRVNKDASMFIGGVRALLYQTLHPDAMFGVAEHSAYNDDPLGRFQRTSAFLETTVYGSGTEARQALAIVRSIHSRVTGTMPDGRPYRADDPHLLGWVHATEVDSFLLGHQKYGENPLDPDECDRYIADMAIIGEGLGTVDTPKNRAELAEVLEFYRAECKPTQECRDGTRFLFTPTSVTSAPFHGLVFAAAAGLLPRWARSMLLLPALPGLDPLLIRPAAEGMMQLLRWAAPEMAEQHGQPSASAA